VDLFSNLEYKMFRPSTNDKDEDFSRYNCGLFDLWIPDRWMEDGKATALNKQLILDRHTRV